MLLRTLKAALLLAALPTAVALAQAPANDDCAGALALPVAPAGNPSAATLTTNVDATDSGVAAPDCSNYAGGDVWFTVTVPASGVVSVSTSAVAGSPVSDTGLAVYGGSCGALVAVDCNDDISSSNYFSRVVVGNRAPGEVLYVRTFVYRNSSQGSYGVQAEAAAPCGAPTQLAVSDVRAGSATLSFTTVAAASSYQLTYTPAGGSPATRTISDSPAYLTGLQAGTTYTLTLGSSCGGVSAPLTFTTAPPAANDEPAGAIALPVGPVCTAPAPVSTLDASASAGVPDPGCADYQGADVWYKVTVPASGVVMLETSTSPDGNTGNTGLAVYAQSGSTLSLLGCDDNSSGVGYSYLRLSGRTPGETLYVRLWLNSGTLGTFSVCATTDDALPRTTWTGASTTNANDWFDAGNWSSGVPTAGTNAYVPTGAGAYPELSTTGQTAEVASLTVDKYTDFTFTAGTLAVSGSFICRNPDATFATLSNFPMLTGGVLELRGAAPRQLSGLGELYDLRLNAPGATATLTAQLRLYHQLTLAGGILNTGQTWVELYNDNIFAGEFLSNARLVGESETSYVLGRVQTRRPTDQGISEDFSGLGLTLYSYSGNTPGLVKLNRYTGTAQAGVNGRASISRYYVADANQDTGLDLTMDLHYFAHELNGLTDADLRPYSSPTTGGGPGGSDVGTPTGPWTLESPSTRLAPVAADSASTLRLTGLTHLSAWTLGSAAAPLPVQLAAFTAEAQGAAALLRWTTASELHNAYFEVEASADGRSFVAVGRVAGAGTSAQARSYQLRDAGLASYGAPVVYYRLRQVDADGSAHYSVLRPVAAPAAAGPAASAFPNPYTQALTVWVTAPAAGPVQVVLRDALGRELLRQSATAAMAGPLELPVAGAAQLPAGLYLLSVTAGGHTTQLRVSRQ